MPRGKRIVSEVQNIKVKKYQYVTDRPDKEEVQRNVRTTEVQKGGGIFSGLGRKKRKRPPTREAEDFVSALEG